MVMFEQIPYRRPNMERLERGITEDIRRFMDATCFEEAYDALTAMEAPRQNFLTMAVICEAYNTMDTNDPFWASESAFFDEAKPRFEAVMTERKRALIGTPYREQFAVHLGCEVFRLAEVTSRAFAPEIAADLLEENKLSARYSELTANLSVEVDGQRLTMGDLTRRYADGSRESRWCCDELRQKAFAEAAEELDRLYDDLVQVRDRIARKLGFSSFTDVGYCRQGRTGYGREEVSSFRDAVARYITPVVRELFEQQRKTMGYETLYSYDEDADGAALKLTHTDPETLLEPAFHGLSPESHVYYDDLHQGKFYDLAERNGKIRGAYSNYLPLYHMPFIFETFDGTPGAVRTLAHECGHGLHSYLKRGELFTDCAEAGADLSEIHSMAMEFFIWPYLDTMYGKNEVKRYKLQHMKAAISFLPYGAAVDEFQTEVYDHPNLTSAQRLELWKALERKYMPWRAYSEGGFLDQGRQWQRQTHIYKWPFYYIDYALAQTCALQFHFKDEENHDSAWEAYLGLLRISGRESFDETLRLAGLESPFNPELLRQLGEKAMEFLKREEG